MSPRVSTKTSEAAPPGRHEPVDRGGDLSQRTAAVVAGIALLAMALLAAVGNFMVVERLVTPGDIERTAGDILRDEGVFRLGVVSFYLIVVLDLVVAWALYRLLAPIRQAISMLAAWFRIGYAAVFLTAVGNLVSALAPLTDPSSFADFSEAQRHTLAWSRIEAFDATWSAGLALFGIHLLLVGYLLTQGSGRAAKVVGGLVALAGAGYLVDAVTKVLLPDMSFELAIYTFVGELVLIWWLLIRGLRRSRSPIRSTR